MAQVQTKPKSRFGAQKFKRRVDVDKAAHMPGGVTAFKTKSWSKDDGTRYGLSVDSETGEFHCDCPDHQFRGRACKHILRALKTLERRHKNEAARNHEARACLVCSEKNAEHEVADDNGHATGERICANCVQRAQARAISENDDPDPYDGFEEWLASERTDEDIQAEAEYFAQQRAADDWADFVEAQMLAEQESVPPCIYCDRPLDIIQTETGGEAFVCNEHGEMPSGYDPQTGEIYQWGVNE